MGQLLGLAETVCVCERARACVWEELAAPGHKLVGELTESDGCRNLSVLFEYYFLFVFLTFIIKFL